jgi:hypothetical protein
MRLQNRWAFTFVVAGAIVWALLKLGAPAAEQDSGESAPPQTSPIFTPAHRTMLDAVREFFGRHPAPVQPIAYTHKVHLANGMECVNCHVNVEKGRIASIPGVQFCMTCHQVMATDKPEIKKMAAYLERGEDIPWQRVYDYPPSAHVLFNHAPHIRAGVDCKTCHGDMRQATVAVRTVNMTMGFCVDCHKLKKASVECMTCHF